MPGSTGTRTAIPPVVLLLAGRCIDCATSALLKKFLFVNI
jgi:hypothetical protein